MKHKIEQERKRQPHVIGHYAAGVRIVGLTDKQLARQMKKLQKTAKKHDSPYARPLPFVTLGPCKEFNKVNMICFLQNYYPLKALFYIDSSIYTMSYN